MDEKRQLLLKRLIIHRLRQASRFWIGKREAREKSKLLVPDGMFKNGNPRSKLKYVCAACLGFFDIKETHMDHINPVIDPNIGFVDWNTYIERLFVDKDGYQTLCIPCHTKKTNDEDDNRTYKKPKGRKNGKK